MADAEFRDAQLAQVFDPRVRAVNELCDALSLEKPGVSVPYVAPHYNAANATILTLSSNPGPFAIGGDGDTDTHPGFLSLENDDPSAERMSEVFATVGLSDEHVLPWNAYPWYVHQAYPNGLPEGLLAEGLDPLKKLLELHPQIRTIVAHGKDAKRAMRQFTSKKRFAPFVAERELKVWEARHTGNRTFVMDATERDAALAVICDTYREVMAHVGVSAQSNASPVTERVYTPVEVAVEDTAAEAPAAEPPAAEPTPPVQPLAPTAVVEPSAVEPVTSSKKSKVGVDDAAPTPAKPEPHLPSGAIKLERNRTEPSSGTELVIEVGDVLSGRTDGATDSQTRSAVRAYLATMSPKRRTELLIELVTQRLNS
jgi:hypothetical protein